MLDHTVVAPDGTRTENPMRVVTHPEGAEIIFTLRRGELSDADFEADAAAVEADLERLAGRLGD